MDEYYQGALIEFTFKYKVSGVYVDPATLIAYIVKGKVPVHKFKKSGTTPYIAWTVVDSVTGKITITAAQSAVLAPGIYGIEIYDDVSSVKVGAAENAFKILPSSIKSESL